MKVEVVKLDVRYVKGHHYAEEWWSTELHCPRCGAIDVWVNAGAGDYYEGPQHLCVGCKATFSLPRLHDALPDNENEQRFAAIGGAAG